MKFLHLGDLHLGKSLGDFDLRQDQEYILHQIIELVREEEIEAVLIAGDVYDRAVPSEAATRLLDDFLHNLAEQKKKVFLISGNHDSDDRLNYGSRLFERSGIHISSVFDGTLSKYTVQDLEGEVNIYLLPFVKASQVKHFFPEEEIESYEDAVKTIIKHTRIDNTKRNILVAHQFVAGKSEAPMLGGSEGIAVQSVGLVEKIGYDIFTDFDYVALGHIHSAQKIGREEVRYSGSPLKYSLSEADNEKSFTVVTLGEKGTVKIELKSVKPLRDVRHIRGKLADLLNKESIIKPEDYIYATLTDEEMERDVMGIFQQFYPNTVKIDYDNSHTRAVEQVDISKIAENKSFPELIEEFYALMYGCEISEEEMDMMRIVAREAGVLHEA